eukprot:959953-Amorphochlora_amoeboformis.AAC.1
MDWIFHSGSGNGLGSFIGDRSMDWDLSGNGLDLSFGIGHGLGSAIGIGQWIGIFHSGLVNVIGIGQSGSANGLDRPFGIGAIRDGPFGIGESDS